MRKHAVFEGHFLPGSAVVARVVGYVNDVLFFNGFSTFKKYKATGKMLLILDKHGSHTILDALQCCKENEIQIGLTDIQINTSRKQGFMKFSSVLVSNLFQLGVLLNFSNALEKCVSLQTLFQRRSLLLHH